MLCCYYTQSLTLLAHQAPDYSFSAAGGRCSSKTRFAPFTCKWVQVARRKPLRIATNAIVLPCFPLLAPCLIETHQFNLYIAENFC
jgi:hypothetical protein